MPVRVAVLFAVLVGMLVTVSSAAAETLPQALTRAGIPSAEKSTYLTTARKARALARRRGGQTGRELRAVLASATAISKQSTLSPALAGIIFRELDANVTYLTTRGLPRSGTRVRIEGIVYERYTNQGLRIQPLGTFWAILEPGKGIAAEGGVAKALDAALAIALPAGDSLTLPYLFPWMGQSPTWQSTMAEGVAAAASVRTWNRSGNEAHLDAGVRFGNAALVDAIPVDGGGLWFPLYSFAPSYRVLNGHLQTVLAMNDLADATGDDGFADAFAQSVLATKTVLPVYNTGGWGRYAPGADAPVKYMTLMASQLKELGAITGDPEFTAMGEAFSRDLVTPPVVKGPKNRSPKPVFLRKNRTPQVKVMVTRDKPVTLTIRVLTKAGKPTKVPPIVIGVSSGTSLVTVKLPRRVGMYRLRASAKDWAGNKVDMVGLIRARVRR